MFSILKCAAITLAVATHEEAANKYLFTNNLPVTYCGSIICRQSPRSNPAKPFAINNLTKKYFIFSSQHIFRLIFASRRSLSNSSSAPFRARSWHEKHALRGIEGWDLSQIPYLHFPPCA